jgi:diphthamide synthase (EF-2-diphthine--ammonia ligase)
VHVRPAPVVPVKILFFSGGKDSFLAVRALVRESLRSRTTTTTTTNTNNTATTGPSFALILLTTFDATIRVIAHQEVPIATVVRQAKYLKIPLLGVPIQRGSSERYVDRIKRAVRLVEKRHAFTKEEGDENAGTTHRITVGTFFTRDIYHRAIASGFDGFGEDGEFHSVAQVWKVSRERALGIV